MSYKDENHYEGDYDTIATWDEMSAVASAMEEISGEDTFTLDYPTMFYGDDQDIPFTDSDWEQISRMTDIPKGLCLVIAQEYLHDEGRSTMDLAG